MKKKKVLITAGSTTVPIDKVRVISNIFKGNTGTNIASYFASQGCDVTLITSNAGLLHKTGSHGIGKVVPYQTYDELYRAMEAEICGDNDYDIVIHSAAVSDYNVTEACVIGADGRMVPLDSSAKISSSHPEIFLRCVQTPKIIDQIRKPWGFDGYLVKFKLQVAIDDQELLGIAHKSRTDSDADMIVANCLEWAQERAYIMMGEDVHPVAREHLSSAVYEKIAAAL